MPRKVDHVTLYRLRLRRNAGCLLHDLCQEIATFLADDLRQVVVLFIQDGPDTLDLPNPLRDDQAKFVEHSTQRI